MKRFWFILSLGLTFTFAASASYIFMAIHGGLREVDQPYRAYQAVGDVTPRVQRVEAADRLLISELYTGCGHTESCEVSGESEFLSLSYDQLTAEGWAVAQTGEHRLSLSRQHDSLCPADAARRLICLTERGAAVYQGTAQHRGNMLLEMPLELSELPPDLMTALASGGYQMESQAELDELLESLDELTGSGRE